MKATKALLYGALLLLLPALALAFGLVAKADSICPSGLC